MENRLKNVYVWSEMPDAMLVRAHPFWKQIRTRITKEWLVKNQEYNQTFGLLTDMTEDLYSFCYSIGIDENAHGWIALFTEDFTCSTGCRDFLIFSTTVDTWHLKNYQECWKAYVSRIHIPLVIAYRDMLAAAIQFRFWRDEFFKNVTRPK